MRLMPISIAAFSMLMKWPAIRVHDLNGDTLYATESERASRGNIAHQAYFQELRQNPGAALVFSELAIERDSSRQVLIIARALRHRAGEVCGVVLGMLELENYRKQFQRLDLGSKGHDCPVAERQSCAVDTLAECVWCAA